MSTLSRKPTAAMLAHMSTGSSKPRTDHDNYWKNMDRALSLALRSTVSATEHALRAHKIARRLNRSDLMALAYDLALLCGFRIEDERSAPLVK